MKLRLTYFNFPFWRAETARLALHLGGIPFEDRRPTREQFKQMKESGELPYGQLPLLEVDGACIAQTPAIARYCAKAAGLYPSDALEAAQVDELLHTIEQLTGFITPSMSEKDPARKAAMRRIAGEESIPKLLDMLERRVTTFGPSPWAVGAQMTVADIALWRALDWLVGGVLDGIPSTLLDTKPRLRGIVEQVGAIPEVRAWMHDKYGATS
jgi:glutathione S-transferase